MRQSEFLIQDQVDLFLRQSEQVGLRGTLSCLRCGTWHVFDVAGGACTDAGFRVTAVSEDGARFDFKKNQPVGICFEHEHHKYIFETIVLEPCCPGQPGGIVLDVPDKIEKVPRRAYERQPIPATLNVRVLFWHRGHQHDASSSPEEAYWQGVLDNLSVGGAMIRVESDHRNFFSIGQYVGVQFTPMSYQKPLLLEGQVRHLKTPPDRDVLLVGIEFLGLEASSEGRDIIHRLLEVIDAYEHLNTTAEEASR